MNVLSVLESDLYGLLEQMAHGAIKQAPKFEKKATVCKYLVPEGYPVKSVTDQPLKIDEGALAATGARTYYASVYEKAGGIYTQSSRSMGMVGIADFVADAERVAEAACGTVSGRVWHRKDIGTSALLQRRLEHMKAIGAL